MSFTRIKDLDLEILSKMDDRELGRICSTDKYFANLCKNDMFWKNRTIRRFGKYFGNELEKYFLKSEKKSWREYYVSIVDFLEKIYARRRVNPGKRKELQLLLDMFRQNDKIFQRELIDRYDEGRWKEMLKLELINPNAVFDYYGLVGDEKKGEEFIRYLLSLQDIRIKPSITIKDFLRMEVPVALAEIILKDERVTVENVIQSIENILEDPDFNVDEYDVLDLYLNYIIKNGAAEQFRDRIWTNNRDQQDLILYIYQRISPYLDSSLSLSKIFEILRTKKFSVLGYDKILDFIEDEAK